MPEPLRKLSLETPEKTVDVASRLSTCLKQGDVLLLQGGLGAGKTHFARAVIQARMAKSGLVEEVPSPTYTIVQTYEDENCEIWHADLYRLSGSAEIDELGLLDAFESSISLIEWPDRLDGLAPVGALTCEFEFTENGDSRTLAFRGDSARWSKVIAGL